VPARQGTKSLRLELRIPVYVHGSLADKTLCLTYAFNPRAEGQAWLKHSPCPGLSTQQQIPQPAEETPLKRRNNLTQHQSSLRTQPLRPVSATVQDQLRMKLRTSIQRKQAGYIRTSGRDGGEYFPLLVCTALTDTDAVAVAVSPNLGENRVIFVFHLAGHYHSHAQGERLDVHICA